MKIHYTVLKTLTFLVIWLFASQAGAFMTGLSTEELTQSSEAVIVGNVEDIESRWNEDGTSIVTTASVVVEEVVRGQVVYQRVTVEYAGGEIGEVGLKVSDVSPLERGEKVLLFLKPVKGKKDGRAYSIVGKGQGKYTVGHDGIARKKGFSLNARREVVDNDTPVEKLIQKIRNVK
jgi:hypothetical protein